MTADYANRRSVHTLAGVTRLNLTVRRCHAPACPRFNQPYRPEAEGAVAMPRHEFGLEVIALVGRLRYAEHRSIPEVHAHLAGRGLAISERAVTNPLDRYDELLAVALADDRRLEAALAGRGRVILAIDGLQPDVSAVRSALTDDGRPPLEASGLESHARLAAVSDSSRRAELKGGYPPNSAG